jgi:hypothetical protein
VASDATVYSELQSQAAKLGADAVLVVSTGMKQYASFPGIATYNANGNLYGNILRMKFLKSWFAHAASRKTTA